MANKIILICNIFITHKHQIIVILSRLQEQKSINGATLELKPYGRDHPYSLFFFQKIAIMVIIMFHLWTILVKNACLSFSRVIYHTHPHDLNHLT